MRKSAENLCVYRDSVLVEADMENTTVKERVVQSTRVFKGANLVSEVVPRLRADIQEGSLFFVYEDDVKPLADELIQSLKKGGYRLTIASVSECENCREKSIAPDFVRHVFAVGAEPASEMAKRIATTLDIGWSLFLTSPESDDIFVAKPPNQVFIDKNVLIKCRCEQIAAGYGILLAKKLTAFEDVFAQKVLSKGSAESVDIDVEKITDASDLAECVLIFSSNKKTQDSAERMAKIMRALALKKGRKPRLDGEYRFLASAAILSFYSLYLGSPGIDGAPPCDREGDMDKLSELKVESIPLKCVDFFDINGYFRIEYILSEYRMDFLEKLAGIDLHGMQRFWRRLYDDAGYWLKGEITASETLSCMALAGAVSDNLLGYAHASGFMSKFG